MTSNERGEELEKRLRELVEEYGQADNKYLDWALLRAAMQAGAEIEREECAVLVESDVDVEESGSSWSRGDDGRKTLNSAARAIRARGGK